MDVADSQPSAEFAAFDTERLADIAERHRQVADFLHREHYQGLLLLLPQNIAWFTAGSACDRGGQHGELAALFITPESRVVVCNNIETPLLFEAELSALGFQLKERIWQEPRAILLADLCRGRRVACDATFAETDEISSRLAEWRLPLSERSAEQMRQTGRLLAHSLESTARKLQPGRTEHDIAGEIAHRLWRNGIHPERIQVLGDGRSQRFRHWTPRDGLVNQFCTVVAVGRQHGLHVGAARTVCFGEPSVEFVTQYQQGAMVLATGMYFSQPEIRFSELWNRIHRIYEKTGVENESRLADQACVCEYEFDAIPLVPDSEFSLVPRMPIYWHPSVGPTMLGETVLVGHQKTEWLTPVSDWPTLKIAVKGVQTRVPNFLVVNG